jgi:putative restriction endonuclease
MLCALLRLPERGTPSHHAIKSYVITVSSGGNTEVKLYVGITDYDWFKLHASKAKVEEVNFWKPSSQTNFRVLQGNEPFLLKLKGRKVIAGGGFFAKFLPLPLSLAWGAFREANGARSLDELRMMIAQSRHRPIATDEDPIIGCTLPEEPFFFEEKDWIPIPESRTKLSSIGELSTTVV